MPKKNVNNDFTLHRAHHALDGKTVADPGAEFEAAAAHIEQASTHWLRHTAGSHLSEPADLKLCATTLGMQT